MKSSLQLFRGSRTVTKKQQRLWSVSSNTWGNNCSQGSWGQDGIKVFWAAFPLHPSLMETNLGYIACRATVLSGRRISAGHSRPSWQTFITQLFSLQASFCSCVKIMQLGLTDTLHITYLHSSIFRKSGVIIRLSPCTGLQYLFDLFSTMLYIG